MSDDSPPVLPDAILGPDRPRSVAGDAPGLYPGELGSSPSGGSNGTPQTQAAEAPARGLPAVQALEGRAGQGREVGTGLVAPEAVGDAQAAAGRLTKKSRDTALIAQRDARIRKKATDIVLSALRAPETAELPENALQAPPQGWTKRQLRIALDATNSMKAAPAYLGMAQRILESYRKAEAETSKPAPVLNATQVVVHQEFHYPTIKVER